MMASVEGRDAGCQPDQSVELRRFGAAVEDNPTGRSSLYINKYFDAISASVLARR
jgi:hypothetical protein